jgi:hypothetical protein
MFNRARNRQQAASAHLQQRQGVMEFLKDWTKYDFTQKL